MAEIVPPIIIDNKHPLEELGFYLTVSALEGHLEYWYATDEDFVAYDSEGRLLEVLSVFPRVAVRALEDAPTHAPDLRRALIAYLSEKRGEGEGLDKQELSQLLEEAMAEALVIGAPRPPGWLRRVLARLAPRFARRS